MFIDSESPSEGFPRLAYLGPGAGWDGGSGGFRGFSAFRRLHKGPGPMGHAHAPSSRAQGPRPILKGGLRPLKGGLKAFLTVCDRLSF